MAHRSAETPVLIFHVDVNSAFLSWSALKELKEHPENVDLRAIPSAVAGDVETRHGIITAKSIPAKKYGIQTAEPVGSALRKCPSLVLVKSDFITYRMYSKKLMELLHTFSPVVEQVSIDEAYLDMSHLWAQPDAALQRRAVEEADRIREEVLSTLGFTVNVGISVNKLLAKTASDFEKPDKTHTLWPDEVPQKLWPLPIGDLHGCGHATAVRLRNLGIRTVGDAARTDPAVLKSLLGESTGAYIANSAAGLGSTAVNGEHEEAKSYSNETTTAEDIGPDNFEKLGLPILTALSEKVSSRLIRDGVYGKTIAVSVKTNQFRRHSRQLTLESSMCSAEIISQSAISLARELLFGAGGVFPRGEKIRLIGVGVSKLDDGRYRQLSLFDPGFIPAQEAAHENTPEVPVQETVREASPEMTVQEAVRETSPETPAGKEKQPDSRQLRLEAMMKKIRDRYGEEAIRKG